MLGFDNYQPVFVIKCNFVAERLDQVDSIHFAKNRNGLDVFKIFWSRELGGIYQNPELIFGDKPMDVSMSSKKRNRDRK